MTLYIVMYPGDHSSIAPKDLSTLQLSPRCAQCPLCQLLEMTIHQMFIRLMSSFIQAWLIYIFDMIYLAIISCCVYLPLCINNPLPVLNEACDCQKFGSICKGRIQLLDILIVPLGSDYFSFGFVIRIQFLLIKK